MTRPPLLMPGACPEFDQLTRPRHESMHLADGCLGSRDLPLRLFKSVPHGQPVRWHGLLTDGGDKVLSNGHAGKPAIPVPSSSEDEVWRRTPTLHCWRQEIRV